MNLLPVWAIVLACLLAACSPPSSRSNAVSQAQPNHSPEALTLGRLTPRSGRPIELTSEAFPPEGVIGEAYSGSGANTSPPLAWTAVPDAGSYAIIVEDPDAPREHPFVHWLIWNLPGNMTALPAGIEAAIRPSGADGPIQGRNDMGQIGYFGPQPPAGHGVHRYHFQIFALDGPLTVSPDADLRTLTSAMQGRVVAQGELMGTFETPSVH
jgi:Raf kinase inhibitor-like YbhB/YbcL family protein